MQPYFLHKINKISWWVSKIEQAKADTVDSMTEKTQSPGFMFPQVVDRHWLGEVG